VWGWTGPLVLVSARLGAAAAQIRSGADGRFHAARAGIEGSTILVSSPEVPAPVAVRYAWADNPEGCNLIKKNGCPASPFRTDCG
jgi:sialate O-acetylesterase